MPKKGDPARLEVSAVLVDSRGRACPLPIIDLAKALRVSAVVELWADDLAAHQDVVAFCEATASTLQRWSDTEGGFQAVVRKGS